MNAIRITCWLAVIALFGMGLCWALQHGVAAPATEDAAAPQDAQDPDSDRAGREVLELTTGLGGFRMPCVECHRHLGSPPGGKDPVARGPEIHKHVVLEHGENNRCFNCHHPDSDKYGSFVSHDGSVIPLEHVEQLCAKCHGPHYRAWKQGAHGQRTGHWNPDLGPQKTAHCNACHHPHQPYFKPISTLSGPRSLWGEHPPDHPCRKAH